MPPNDTPAANNTAEQLHNRAQVDEARYSSILSRNKDNNRVSTFNSFIPIMTSNDSSGTTTCWSRDRPEQVKSRGDPVLMKYTPQYETIFVKPLSETLPILSPLYTTANKDGHPNTICSDVLVVNEKINGYCSIGGLNQPPSKGSLTSATITDSTASLVPSDDRVDGLPCVPCKDAADSPPESLRAMIVQVFIPFLIAGFGMVGAGLVLDKVQHWDVFVNVRGIYIVVPPLLGLKGNLEMTLASRLSTLANLGNIDTKKSLLPYVGGNMLISQCLASGIGFITSLVAVVINWMEMGTVNMQHSFLLISSSVATAALSSFLLDSIMVLVILTSRRYGINPDNVATPIAASLGDITTVSLLAGIGSGLYNIIIHIVWLGPVISAIFLIMVPIWIFIASKHTYTAQALKTTFMPVLGAMFISTGGGFILDIAVKSFKDIAVFQPIINGVGGNLVAIQASRIATSLHQQCTMGILPSYHPRVCVNPCTVFFGKEIHARCIRILIMMVVPGHLIFIYMTSFISTGRDSLTLSFVGVYLIAALLQVAILLYIATILTYLVWRIKIDPDNFSIPLLTALGDLLGIGLLFVAFIFLSSVGQPVDLINTSLINTSLNSTQPYNNN